MGEFILTIDIDWAPDFVIDEVAARLSAHGVRATWFVTHASPAVERLRAAGPLFELGVHPNFLPGSTHGSTVDEVFAHVSRLVPDAISVRCHGLVQSGALMEQILMKTSLAVECNQFLPLMPHISPVVYERCGRTLLRVPFFWADDYEMGRSRPAWSLEPLAEVEGLKVLLFHPITVYLNASTGASYAAIKSAATDLTTLAPGDAAPHINPGPGAGDLFRATVDRLARRGRSRTLRDLWDDWRNA